MSGLFGRWADLNRDGEIDNFEEFMAMEMLTSADEAEDDDIETELEAAGLDCEELSWMNEEERREALEDAGLDPDDYDF